MDDETNAPGKKKPTNDSIYGGLSRTRTSNIWDALRFAVALPLFCAVVCFREDFLDYHTEVSGWLAVWNSFHEPYDPAATDGSQYIGTPLSKPWFGRLCCKIAFSITAWKGGKWLGDRASAGPPPTPPPGAFSAGGGPAGSPPLPGTYTGRRRRTLIGSLVHHLRTWPHPRRTTVLWVIAVYLALPGVATAVIVEPVGAVVGQAAFRILGAGQPAELLPVLVRTCWRGFAIGVLAAAAWTMADVVLRSCGDEEDPPPPFRSGGVCP